MNAEEKQLQHLLEENKRLHNSNMKMAEEEGLDISQSQQPKRAVASTTQTQTQNADANVPLPEYKTARRQRQLARAAARGDAFRMHRGGKQLHVLVDESTQGNPPGIEEDVPATVTAAPPGTEQLCVVCMYACLLVCVY
jgi:hypothetical protein